jgi:hypothetical protein
MTNPEVSSNTANLLSTQITPEPPNHYLDYKLELLRNSNNNTKECRELINICKEFINGIETKDALQAKDIALYHLCYKKLEEIITTRPAYRELALQVLTNTAEIQLKLTSKSTDYLIEERLSSFERLTDSKSSLQKIRKLDLLLHQNSLIQVALSKSPDSEVLNLKLNKSLDQIFSILNNYKLENAKLATRAKLMLVSDLLSLQSLSLHSDTQKVSVLIRIGNFVDNLIKNNQITPIDIAGVARYVSKNESLIQIFATKQNWPKCLFQSLIDADTPEFLNSLITKLIATNSPPSLSFLAYLKEKDRALFKRYIQKNSPSLNTIISNELLTGDSLQFSSNLTYALLVLNNQDHLPLQNKLAMRCSKLSNKEIINLLKEVNTFVVKSRDLFSKIVIPTINARMFNIQSESLSNKFNRALSITLSQLFRYEASDQLIENIKKEISKYNLPAEELLRYEENKDLGVWYETAVGKLRFKNIFDSIQRIKELEAERPGATEKLFKFTNIKIFYRYSLDQLVEQYDFISNPANFTKSISIELNNTHDNNLQAFVDIPSREGFINEGKKLTPPIKHLIFEWTSEFELVKILTRIKKHFPEVELICLASHGNKKGLMAGNSAKMITSDLLSSINLTKLLSKHCPDAPLIIIDSCEVANKPKKAFTAKISKTLTELKRPHQIHAPKKHSALDNIKLTRDALGKLQVHFNYDQNQTTKVTYTHQGITLLDKNGRQLRLKHS